MLICEHQSCTLLLYTSIGLDKGINFRRKDVLEKSIPGIVR